MKTIRWSHATRLTRHSKRHWSSRRKRCKTQWWSAKVKSCSFRIRLTSWVRHTRLQRSSKTNKLRISCENIRMRCLRSGSSIFRLKLRMQSLRTSLRTSESWTGSLERKTKSWWTLRQFWQRTMNGCERIQLKHRTLLTRSSCWLWPNELTTSRLSSFRRNKSSKKLKSGTIC